MQGAIALRSTITVLINRSIGLLLCSVLFCSAGAAESTNALVDVAEAVPGIILDIRYATTNNFTGKQVYPVAKCFLRESTAKKLKAVQTELRAKKLGLKVYDGYRPLSVQKKFWELVPDERYVANPAKGSKHNRGGAVDVTLVDEKGKELSMPTPYDDFSEKAHYSYTELPPQVLKNRELLKQVMEKHGFQSLDTEWWHFDDKEWKAFELMDLSFEQLIKGAETK